MLQKYLRQKVSVNMLFYFNCIPTIKFSILGFVGVKNFNALNSDLENNGAPDTAEKIIEIRNKSPTPPMKNIPDDFPSPFKNTLFWPAINTSKTKKKTTTGKVPAVATSKEWQHYFQKKEKDKADKIQELQDKRKKRQEAADKRKKEKEASQKNKKKKKLENNNNKENWYCIICEEDVQENMIQCLSCKIWVHEKCANVSKSAKKFHCSSCRK